MTRNQRLYLDNNIWAVGMMLATLTTSNDWAALFFAFMMVVNLVAAYGSKKACELEEGGQ